MSRPQDAIAKLSRGESVEVAQKDGESASGEALPEGWADGTLNDLSEITMGNSPPSSTYNQTGDGIPLVNGPVEFSEGQLGPTHVTKYTTAPSRTCKEGDFLLCVRGSTTGRSNIAAFDACIGRGVASIRAYEYQPFVNHFVASKRQAFYDMGTGSTFPSVSQKQIGAVRVGVPPLAEQSRIVSAIESLQERSSRARVLLSEVGPLIGQLRQSVLRDAFSGKLTADWRETNLDVEPASELLSRIRTERRERWETEQLAKYEAQGKQPPKNWQDKYKEPDVTFDEDAFDTEFQIDKSCGWEVVPLELLVDPEKSIPYGIVKTGDPYPNGVPTVRCGDIKRFSIAINDLKLVNPEVHEQYRRTWLEGGEVIIAIRGTVGETAVVPAEMKGMNISREVALIPVLPGVDSTFLMYLLASPAAQRLITGQVKGVAQSGINLADLRMLPTPLPSLEEQQEIARQIEEALNMLDSVLAIQASMESSLTQLDQSILSKAFRGELVPQDPRDEPASELLARIRAKRDADAAKKTSKKKKTTTAKAASNAK